MFHQRLGESMRAYSGRFYHEIVETYPYDLSDRAAIEIYARGLRPYCRPAPPISWLRSFGEMRQYFENYDAYMHLGDVLSPAEATANPISDHAEDATEDLMDDESEEQEPEEFPADDPDYDPHQD